MLQALKDQLIRLTGPSSYQDSQNLDAQIPAWLSLARRVLPEETKLIDNMLDEIMAQSSKPIVSGKRL